MDDPFVTAVSVGHTYQQQAILQDVSLTIQRGAFVTLVGPSGVGKSTFLRIVGGLLRPSQGHIQFHDPEHTIGIVFQHDNLMPWRTTYENVRLPLELRGQSGKSADHRVREMLQLVGLHGFERTYPAQLSGGMAQRVALARALVHQPSFLLLDEPFGALDALTRERMGAELLRIWEAMPVTVFMVTHSISEAVFLSDEVWVMGSNPARMTHQIPVPLPRPRQLNKERTAVFQQTEMAVHQAIEENTHFTS